VSIFGTENRVTEAPVAPTDRIFEYVTFRGEDIKDLHVHDAQQEEEVRSEPLFIL
ncbi:unnamed protein product, partial [Choristocarpus tenellus]